MSEKLLFPWISLSVLLLCGSTIRTWRATVAETARRMTINALGTVFLLLVAAGIEVERAAGGHLFQRMLEPLPGWAQWVSLDSLNGVPLPLYAGLVLGMVILAPRRKLTPAWLTGIQILTLSTIVAYGTGNLVLFALAWTGSLVPFFGSRFFNRAGEVVIPRRARLILGASAVLVVVGVMLLAVGTTGTSWANRLRMGLPHDGQSPLLYLAFICLMIGVFLRKGLFPAHTWVVPSFAQGPLIPLNLLFNGHLGAFLIARLAVPAFPGIAPGALSLLGDLGLLTAGYTAILAIGERRPRRLLALLTISQSSFLVAGLESTNPDAIAGALVHWQVVVVATSILTAVYASLEARLGRPLDNEEYLGLAKGAPRLAVFFLIGGLALVGLPLTLGFAAEDLLLHGTLETHPQLGIILPIVTALNAFHMIRLFSSLFLGQPGRAASTIADALPRERWVLTAAILFLIIGGLFPEIFVHLPARAAADLIETVGRTAPSGH